MEAKPKKKPAAYKIDEKDMPNLLHDYAVPYKSMAEANTSSYDNAVLLLDRSKKGLSAKAALDFLAASGFSHQQFQDVFKTTVKTIQNYNTLHQKLDASLSEKLLLSFALFDKGISVFGSTKAFYNWLMAPAYGLGGQIPFDLMDMFTGIKVIEEELIRLEYGDLA